MTLIRGFKVALGLCLLVLGVFGAGSAQAHVWMVGGADLTTGSKQVVGSLDTTGVLHTKIGGNAVLFECSTGELVNVFLVKEGGVTGGDVKFSGCITKINGTVNPICEPNNTGTEPGVILTNPIDGLLNLHKLANETKDRIVLLTSLVEETIGGVKQPVFARIKMPAECPIGTNIPIIGPQISLKDVTGLELANELETELLSHLIEEFAPLTEIWALSKTEEHKASILGKANIRLTSDELWSGLPL